jgi:hypothetical protein
VFIRASCILSQSLCRTAIIDLARAGQKKPFLRVNSAATSFFRPFSLCQLSLSLHSSHLDCCPLAKSSPGIGSSAELSASVPLPGSCSIMLRFVIVALALLLSTHCVDGGASLVSSFIQSAGFAGESKQALLALQNNDVEQFLTTASDRLIIQRRNGESIQLYVDNGEVIVRVGKKVQQLPKGATEGAPSHGIFGFYKLPEGHYVALIAASSKVDVPL